MARPSMVLLALLLAPVLAAMAQTETDAGSIYKDPTFAIYDGGRVEPRLEIRQFDEDPTLWRQRTLLLLAWSATVARPVDDIYSFASLVRVHGMPFGAPLGLVSNVWNGTYANQTRWWAGACHHADTVFPPWHRLYMLTFERILRVTALQLARKAARAQPRDDAAAWLEAAEKLRLPRWDYTDPKTIVSGPPALLISPQVVVVDPATGATRTINNPIYSFASPWRLNDPADCKVPGGCVGLSFQPEDRLIPVPPWAKGAFGYDVVPLNQPPGTPTLRWPTNKPAGAPGNNPSQYASNDALFVKMLKLVTPSLILLTKTTLGYSKWWCFWVSSIKGQRPPGTKCPLTALVSYNEVHGLVHGTLGGINPLLKISGHGAYTESSSLDPVFFLLHTHLDYILAIYMELYPTQYVEPGANYVGTYFEFPGTYDDVNTPLAPWRKPETSGFFTSADVKQTEPWGYTYGAVQEARRRAATAEAAMQQQQQAGKEGAEEEKQGAVAAAPSAAARAAAMRGVLNEMLAAQAGAAGRGGYEYIATFARFPAGELRLQGLPSHQFMVLASVGPLRLPEALSGAAPAENLCGLAFNFDGMVPARANATMPVTMVITECLKAGGWPNSAPRVPGEPALGPASVPAGLTDGSITYTVLGLDGHDYSDSVRLGRPTLRWALDTTVIGGGGAGGAGAEPAAADAAAAAAWEPVVMGVVEQGSPGDGASA